MLRARSKNHSDVRRNLCYWFMCCVIYVVKIVCDQSDVRAHTLKHTHPTKGFCRCHDFRIDFTRSVHTITRTETHSPLVTRLLPAEFPLKSRILWHEQNFANLKRANLCRIFQNQQILSNFPRKVRKWTSNVTKKECWPKWEAFFVVVVESCISWPARIILRPLLCSIYYNRHQTAQQTRVVSIYVTASFMDWKSNRQTLLCAIALPRFVRV